MTIFRRVLLVSSALAALLGLAIVAVALVPRTQTKPPDAPSAPMLQVPSGSSSASGVMVVTGPLLVDAREVSVAQYEACVRAGACPFFETAASVERTVGGRGASAACAAGREDAAEAAINCIDYPAAEAYCRWAGKRLPTRDEWWVALAAHHQERWETLHRTPTRAGWALSEWTSTAPVLPNRGEVSPLRFVATWSNDPGEPHHAKVYPGSYARVDRSSQLSFRCVQ